MNPLDCDPKRDMGNSDLRMKEIDQGRASRDCGDPRRAARRKTSALQLPFERIKIVTQLLRLFLLLIALPCLAAEFPAIYNTEKETIPFLKPDDALALVKAPEGFKVTMFASEPMVQQPI